jgi:poly(3-hydroxybutyrate) depolymerase
MWYSLLDTQRRLAKAFADSMLTTYGLNCAEWDATDATRAARDWLTRSTCALESAPPFAIGAVRSGGEYIAVEESIADEMPIGTLRKFARGNNIAAPPSVRSVILCAPLAGHHGVMLRETVETLLETCDVVYITDWADARDVPLEAGPLTLADYVQALERFIRLVWVQGAPAHIVAVCQACVPALAAASLLASSETPPFASVSLLGGPIDTRLHPTSVDRFASSRPLQWFRDNVIDQVPPPYCGVGRRVYPGFIQQAAIVAAQPARQFGLEARYWSNWFSGNLEDAQAALRSLNEYAAVLDMSEHYFLDMIRVVFQEHLLARGTWSIDGRCVETRAVGQVPLCTIEGDRDDITGADQTHCAHALCHASGTSRHRRVTVDQCDHYDLFTGPRWHDVVHPQLCEFWHAIERSHAKVKRPAHIR